MFVNEVLDSEKLQTINHGVYCAKPDREYKPCDAFKKNIIIEEVSNLLKMTIKKMLRGEGTGRTSQLAEQRGRIFGG